LQSIIVGGAATGTRSDGAAAGVVPLPTVAVYVQAVAEVPELGGSVSVTVGLVGFPNELLQPLPVADQPNVVRGPPPPQATLRLTGPPLMGSDVGTAVIAQLDGAPGPATQWTVVEMGALGCPLLAASE
jgi:hypothetical protein